METWDGVTRRSSHCCLQGLGVLWCGFVVQRSVSGCQHPSCCRCEPTCCRNPPHVQLQWWGLNACHASPNCHRLSSAWQMEGILSDASLRRWDAELAACVWCPWAASVWDWFASQYTWPCKWDGFLKQPEMLTAGLQPQPASG